VLKPDILLERSGESMGAGWGTLVDGAPPARTGKVSLVPPSRDQRLDMFRGIALVMIFINHVPGTIYEGWTSRNFGFSDSAEAFVFMSGLAAGLAYSSRFAANALAATAKIWARARQLYFVHLAITLLTLAIFAAGAMWFDLPELLTSNNIKPLFHQPMGVMIGIPAMTHQLGYLNILPLYIGLMLMTPLFLWVAQRRPLVLLGGSVLVWAIAGQFRLNLPNFPNEGGWFFNPFSWQLLFVIGLLCGCSMKQGIQFVPLSRRLLWITASFLIVVLFWVRFDDLGAAGRDVLDLFSRLGMPFYITGFDKTFVALPRLLHALALFYVMASLGSVRRLADSGLAAPFKLLGRNGLPVFAVGTVLSMALQAIKMPFPSNPLTDGLLLLAGLGLQLGLAWLLVKTSELKSVRTAT
jgi:hypothetical protein